MKIERVGIMGGGQLAFMLAHAAFRMGLKPIVLAEDAVSPAGKVFTDAIFGSPQDREALELFFTQATHIIFENEFVDCRLLREVAEGKGITFLPSLDAISRFQDKLEQKKILFELDIPTADYFILNFQESLKDQLSKIIWELGGSCVLKWSRMGYDGKGVLVVNDLQESLSRIESFVQEAQKKKSAVYAERKIQFKRELAMVSSYSTRGEFLSYPLVVSEQKNGICFQVTGPATQLGVSLSNEQRVESYMQKIAQSAQLIGSFAMELFETQQGELIVNEIAPRVHNSGHYTQNACATDQFENHWRAVLGMPLGQVQARSCFAMLNLLGPDFPVQSEKKGALPSPGSRGHLHWYHKTEIRPGRKLGHLNAVAESMRDLGDIQRELMDCHDSWLDFLNGRNRG